jgi:Tol biopolymer transport system component
MGNPATSITVMNPDGSDRKRVFLDQSGAAMAETWSPDGKKLIFGFGGFFPARDVKPARLIIVDADGSEHTDLTGKSPNEPNTGFPSWSSDGKKIVYRIWTKNSRGLQIMDLDDHSVRTLTTEWDNFPFWSPNGDRIVFTRQKDVDFDIFTIKPDGTDLQQLTTSPGTDGHATWMPDGKRLFFSSSRAGFKDEIYLYDNSPQPYAQVFIMNADGSNQHQVTDSRWEDSMAIYVTQPEQPTQKK